jgi:transposase-like protein
MADILHGSARTTPRVRAELQASKETSGSLARRYGLSRTGGPDDDSGCSHGAAHPKSTVLPPVEEAMIVEFRQRTLLPLDDIHGCLKDTIPKLTHSSLHRCLERHGISRLPESEDNASKRGRFAVHIDICELRLAEGKINMFLAIDRVSKFTYVEFHENTGKMNGADFLRNVVKAFPYKIHTVLTDNGMAFADLPKNRNGASWRYLGAHIFDRACAENGIEHRLTKPYHPWTNGQLSE